MLCFREFPQLFITLSGWGFLKDAYHTDSRQCRQDKELKTMEQKMRRFEEDSQKFSDKRKSQTSREGICKCDGR